MPKGEYTMHSKLLGEHALVATFKEVSKTDDSIEIEGWANRHSINGEEIIDRDGEVVLPTAYDLSNFTKNPIMLYMHNRERPIGKITEIGVKGEGLYVKGVVEKSLDPATFDGILKGVLTTFSIGFRGKQGVYDPEADVYYYTNIELYEVSVVTIPANQDSIFTIVDSPCSSGTCALGVTGASTKFSTKELNDMSKNNKSDENPENTTIYTVEQLEQLRDELEKAIKYVSKLDGEPTQSTPNSEESTSEKDEEDTVVDAPAEVFSEKTDDPESTPDEGGEEDTPSSDDVDQTPPEEGSENSSVTVAEAVEVLRSAAVNQTELETLVEFYEVFTEELNDSVEAYLTAASDSE